MPATLAWIPLLQPAPGAAVWWWLLVLPLSLCVSMAWKAVRLESLDHYWQAVARMGAQIIGGMISLFVVLAVVVRFIVPLIPGN